MPCGWDVQQPFRPAYERVEGEGPEPCLMGRPGGESPQPPLKKPQVDGGSDGRRFGFCWMSPAWGGSQLRRQGVPGGGVAETPELSPEDFSGSPEFFFGAGGEVTRPRPCDRGPGVRGVVGDSEDFRRGLLEDSDSPARLDPRCRISSSLRGKTLEFDIRGWGFPRFPLPTILPCTPCGNRLRRKARVPRWDANEARRGFVKTTCLRIWSREGFGTA